MDSWFRVNSEVDIDEDMLTSLGLTREGMKEVAIDFTMFGPSSRQKHIIDKVFKYYQQKDRPLFIVIYGKIDPKVFEQYRKEFNEFLPYLRFKRCNQRVEGL